MKVKANIPVKSVRKFYAYHGNSEKKYLLYLIGFVGGKSVMAMSDAALYATSEFSAASFLSFPDANSARYR